MACAHQYRAHYRVPLQALSDSVIPPDAPALADPPSLVSLARNMLSRARRRLRSGERPGTASITAAGYQARPHRLHGRTVANLMRVDPGVRRGEKALRDVAGPGLGVELSVALGDLVAVAEHFRN